MRPLSSFAARRDIRWVGALLLSALVGIGAFATPSHDLNLVAGSPFSAGGLAVRHRGITLGDIDGDGDNDVVTVTAGTSHQPGSVVVMKNNGFGKLSFASATLGTFRAFHCVLGDWNGDSHLDAAVQNATFVSIFLGNGGGELVHHVNIAIPGATPPLPFLPILEANPQDIGTGDFNRDGKADLVVSTFPANKVHVLVGNGQGGFAPHTYGFGELGLPGPLATTGVDVADVNGDGDLDLAVAGSTGDVRFYYGTAGAGFTEDPSQSIRTLVAPVDVVFGDIDGDGDRDLISRHNDAVALMTNNGRGIFTYAAKADLLYGPDLAIRDLDGDGREEIVTSSGSRLVILGYDGSALRHASGSPIAVKAGHVAIGPMKKGGLPDILVAHPSWGISVFLNGSIQTTDERSK